MATLYELTGQYLDIYNLEIDDETKLDTIESLGLDEEIEAKAENYAKLIRNLEADKKVYKDEEERFKKKKESTDKKIERLKRDLQASMEITGKTKIKGELFTLSIQNTKASVVVDEAKLPEKYWTKKVTEAPNKKELYDLLKAGEEIEGATLQENRSLRIK
jgi:gp157|nr:MAG TPA: resistance protein [Caudoviricetes sp.]